MCEPVKYEAPTVDTAIAEASKAITSLFNITLESEQRDDPIPDYVRQWVDHGEDHLSNLLDQLIKIKEAQNVQGK